MAAMGEDIRARTDALDAAGNTTAAIGKGFCIGSAALVSLALFGAYITRANISVADSSILDPQATPSIQYTFFFHIPPPSPSAAQSSAQIGFLPSEDAMQLNQLLALIVALVLLDMTHGSAFCSMMKYVVFA